MERSCCLRSQSMHIFFLTLIVLRLLIAKYSCVLHMSMLPHENRTPEYLLPLLKLPLPEFKAAPQGGIYCPHHTQWLACYKEENTFGQHI